MKPTWQHKSWAMHQEYLKRVQANGRLTTEADLLDFLALALWGEAEELGHCLTKRSRGEAVLAADFAHAIADIRIYLEQLAMHLGIDIDQACEEKLALVAGQLAAA